jgi:diadenosine tetraphosphatase ApaH/serine/threonine PP2A family protein phosphatase
MVLLLFGEEFGFSMRILVVSDIHANLPAFQAVLNAAGKWDQIWCLGDLVGYGPNPNECVALLREHDHISLSGNHDWAALDKLDIGDFNDDARAAVLWTRAAMSQETRDYLDVLPPSRVVEPFTLAHASPRHPVWEYVLDYDTAVANFAYFDTPYCLIGHSHVPLLIIMDGLGDLSLTTPEDAHLERLNDRRAMINPGSVGQPRDGDPRAAFALLDTETMTWEFRRVVYPIEETQRRMRQYNFPEPLVGRLPYGW